MAKGSAHRRRRGRFQARRAACAQVQGRERVTKWFLLGAQKWSESGIAEVSGARSPETHFLAEAFLL